MQTVETDIETGDDTSEAVDDNDVGSEGKSGYWIWRTGGNVVQLHQTHYGLVQDSSEDNLHEVHEIPADRSTLLDPDLLHHHQCCSLAF